MKEKIVVCEGNTVVSWPQWLRVAGAQQILVKSRDLDVKSQT